MGESPDSTHIKNWRIETGLEVYKRGNLADWDLSGSYTNLATKHYTKWVFRKLEVRELPKDEFEVN